MPKIGDPGYVFHKPETPEEKEWMKKRGCLHPEGCRRDCPHFINNTCPLT